MESSVVAHMRSVLLLSGLMAALLLSGCTASQGADGQQAAAGGSLAYQGASAGEHSSTFDCDSGEASVSVGGQLGSGSVTVTVRDADGATVYTRTFNGPGQSADSRRSDAGEPGEWTVSASRRAGSDMYGGGWSGQYGISVAC